MKFKVLILYAEFLGYNHTAISAFSDLVQEAEIHVVNWDQNRKTPYIIGPIKRTTFYRKSNFTIKSLKKFIIELEPSVILVSTRTDKDYLKVLLAFKNRIKIVGLTDAQYKGLLTQRIQVLFPHFFYHRYFDFMWVAGVRQYEFVKRLGYKDSNIFLNSLVCDSRFQSLHLLRQKSNIKNNTIYYIGRFSPEKGVVLLISAFIEIVKLFTDWKLVLIGNGPLQNEMQKHPNIIIKDFMQPTNLIDEIVNIGIFCLPSHSDAWGVALHEMCAAGVPVIASDAVGASSNLIINGYNGFTFKNMNQDDLVKKLVILMSTSEDELKLFGKHSNILGNNITPELWAYTLKFILESE